MELTARRGGITLPGQPREIRKVIVVHTATGPMQGKPKVVKDIPLGITIARIKAQIPRDCEGVCIWGGAIERGEHLARVDVGTKRRMNKRMVPVTKEYHFSCLPDEAMPLRRFFTPLQWKARIVLGPDYSETRKFESVEEWRAWIDTHFPDMRRKFSWQNSDDTAFQVGTDYYWCRLDRL